jgi:hypothetical protein
VKATLKKKYYNEHTIEVVRRSLLGAQVAILFFLLLNLIGCDETPNFGPGFVVLSQSQATYSQLASTVLPLCIGCHSDQNASGQVSFSSYASTMDSAGTIVPYQPYQSQMFMMTSTGEMPKEGPSLSAVQLAQIYYWIAYGAPNN